MFSQEPRSKFSLVADLRPIVPQEDNSWQSESHVSEFDDLGYSLSPGIKETGLDRKGVMVKRIPKTM
jgi:hypothetical protein